MYSNVRAHTLASRLQIVPGFSVEYVLLDSVIVSFQLDYNTLKLLDLLQLCVLHVFMCIWCLVDSQVNLVEYDVLRMKHCTSHIMQLTWWLCQRT